MKIIFFDLETTGLVAAKESILEVAAMCIDENFNILDSYSSFINPGRPIPYFISNLTGITDSTVRNSRSEGIVMNDFMNWVHAQGATTIAGHNIKRFDIKWIEEKTHKYGIKNTLPTNALDTLDYANALYKDGVLSEYTATTPTGRMSFKLEHLISYFDLDTQTHRAIDDVRQNVIVYKRLQELEKTKDYGF